MLSGGRRFLRQLPQLARRRYVRRAEERSSLEELGVGIGSRHSGFLVTSIEKIEEFDIQVVQLLHEETKARHVHIDTADTNNTFSVVFRTPPTDSSGVPHVLEHCVLCGSESFPVRDPFFNMLKRSLNTFMNAMTASDFTSYPFSTRNAQDFSNLLSVYLDATFFPLLRENDFLQEGHRLEFNDRNELLRSGVVYNEMKGRCSGSINLFLYEMSDYLFKDTNYCYSYNSGGLPEEIPSLTYEQLLQFHKLNYHPSNSFFFTFGDLPLTDHLKQIEKVIERFEFDTVANMIGRNIKGSGEKVELEDKVISGPLEAMSDKESQIKFVLMKKLDFETTDEYLSLKLRVLNNLLLEGLNSPMYSKLISSNLAPDYSPGIGYDGYNLVPTFSIGVQNIQEKDINIIETTILDELENISKHGFPEQMVDATLHQIELQLKQKQTHFGLMLLQAATKSWTHSISDNPDSFIDYESNIIESLTVNDKIEKLKIEMRNSNFWQNLIKKYLLKGDKFTKFTMKPEDNFIQKLEEIEKENLKKIEKKLNENEKNLIKLKAEESSLEREKIADLSCLPTLTIKDISKKDINEVDLDFRQNWLSFPNVKESTNDVVYLNLLFDASKVKDQNLVKYLPLFCSLLGNVDTDQLSFQEFALETQLNCGGVNYNTITPHWLGDFNSARERNIYHNIEGEDNNLYRKGLLISTHCFRRNLKRTLELIFHSITGADFERNPEHIQSLLSTCTASATNSLSENSLGYARNWVIAPFSEVTELNESLSGLTQVQHLVDTNKNFNSAELCEVFDKLSTSLFTKDNLQIKVVSNSDKHFIENELSVFRQNLNWSSKATGLENLEMFPQKTEKVRRSKDATYIPLPISVHNSICALSTGVSFNHPDSGSVSLLAELMSGNFLHRQIREKGGAYGAQASHNQSGILTLSSYYDPQTTETLKVFKESLDWICQGSFTETDVEEALLSMFSSIDAPRNLSLKGHSEFLHGLTKEQKQKYRDSLFGLSKNDLVSKAEKYLGVYCVEDFDLVNYSKIQANSDLNSKVSVAIIGNEENANLFTSTMGWNQYKFKHTL